MSDIENIDLSNGELPPIVVSESEDETINNSEKQAIVAIEQEDDSVHCSKSNEEQKQAIVADEQEDDSLQGSTLINEQQQETEAIDIMLAIEQYEKIVALPSDSEREDESTCCPSTCSSVKKKKNTKKKKKKSGSVSREPRLSFESDATSSKKKERKKKKPKSSDNSTQETSLSSDTSNNSGSTPKRKKKKKSISQIDMSGDVSEMSFDDASGVRKKKKKRSKQDGSARTMGSMIQEIDLTKPRRPRQIEVEKSRAIEYGGAFLGYNYSISGDKKNRREKRSSVSTNTTFDYDEEDPHMRFSSSTMQSFRGFNERYGLPRNNSAQRRYDGQSAEYYRNGDRRDIHVDESVCTDYEDDTYTREVSYSDVQSGLYDEQYIFKKATFALADTGVRDTKCCLVAMITFFCIMAITLTVILAKKIPEWTA